VADYPKIAQVIYNRLDPKNDPKVQRLLQIDATVNYLTRKPTQKPDVNAPEVINSPYNTYHAKGLPPGPIGNPGVDALKAALHPEQGPWLWYVLKDKQGNHLFTADYNEFQKQKAKSHEEGLF
jgi:UPF0755 protein